MRAIALIDLGLSGRDFGRNTHRTMGALIDRVERNRKREDFRAGQICATIGNSIPRDGDALSPEDFFPALRTPQISSPDQVRDVFRAAKAMQK